MILMGELGRVLPCLSTFLVVTLHVCGRRGEWTLFDITQCPGHPSTPTPAKNNPAQGASSAEAEIYLSVTQNEQTESVCSNTSQVFSDRPDTSTYNFMDIKFTDNVRHQDSSSSVGLGGSMAWNVLFLGLSASLRGSIPFVTICL